MASLRHRFQQPFGAGSLVLSLGLHLALVTFVLMTGWYKPLPPALLEVSLVAPLPGDQAAPGKANSGGPSQAVRTQVHQPSSKSPLALKAVSKPAPPPRKKRVKAETMRPQRPTPPLALSPAAPPAPFARDNSGLTRSASGPLGHGTASDATGSGPGAEGNSGNGGRGQGTGGGGPGGLAVAQTQYLSLIRARILAHRSYPPLARARHMEGEVRLRFILTHNGALRRGVQIVKPSGFSVLDEQASQCVLAAAPFPPFPPELRRDSLTVEVPILYRLQDGSG
jgi:protein TonB